MHRLNYGLFRLALGLVGLLPFSVLYVMSDLLYLLLYRIFGYRRKVVRANLLRAFPDLSPTQRLAIERGSYHNLFDVLLEGLKALAVPADVIRSRFTYLNPELANAYTAKNQSVIAATGHLGNWEWVVPTAGYSSDSPLVGLYKPLKNPLINDFLRRKSEGHRLELVSIRETHQGFEDRKGRPYLYILAADQSPSNMEKAIWADFFGIHTPFLHGPEVYARAHQMPVVFAWIERTRRGHYALTLEHITDEPHLLPPGELTRQYAALLEATIRRNPTQWLWSHRRWKRITP